MSKTSDFFAAWLETEDGRRLPLRGNYRLGRAPDNHVIIDGTKASRHHAAIHAQDDREFWLIDLGSRNGTFCNEHRVVGPMRLHSGDRISLAGAGFVFRKAAESAAHLAAGSDITIMDFKAQRAWLLIVDMESFVQLSHDWPPETLALNVGRFIQEGQRLVGSGGGRISKFLGDGFLACWECARTEPRAVAATLQGFRALRDEGAIKFRVVVHYGVITLGGASQFGEESMVGAELNFIFRLEKLASELGVTFCASAPAQALLDEHLPFESVEGHYEFKGFAGQHRCFRIAWPA